MQIIILFWQHSVNQYECVCCKFRLSTCVLLASRHGDVRCFFRNEIQLHTNKCYCQWLLPNCSPCEMKCLLISLKLTMCAACSTWQLIWLWIRRKLALYCFQEFYLLYIMAVKLARPDLHWVDKATYTAQCSFTQDCTYNQLLNFE